MNVYCDHVIAINSRAAFEIPSVSALLANAELHREPAFGRLRPPLAELAHGLCARLCRQQGARLAHVLRMNHRLADVSRVPLAPRSAPLRAPLPRRGGRRLGACFRQLPLRQRLLRPARACITTPPPIVTDACRHRVMPPNRPIAVAARPAVWWTRAEARVL